MIYMMCSFQGKESLNIFRVFIPSQEEFEGNWQQVIGLNDLQYVGCRCKCFGASTVSVLMFGFPNLVLSVVSCHAACGI